MQSAKLVKPRARLLIKGRNERFYSLYILLVLLHLGCHLVRLLLETIKEK